MNLFSAFRVIPAIDLKNGEVVRLRRGNFAEVSVYGSHPERVAREFEEQGAHLLHVVDLDGARSGAPRNLEAIRLIRRAVSCQLEVSGGLRTLSAIRQAFAAGADLVTLGTAAVSDPELLTTAAREFPAQLLGAVDVREGAIATDGWERRNALPLSVVLERLRDAGVLAVVHTDISRDGTEAGVDAEAYARFARRSGLPVIASGGVARLADIERLRQRFSEGVVGVIVGRALYERRFALAEALKLAGSD